ncbi:hypothetical protein YC2023_060030 [Brassica napus]|uniref:(rape) hypothetical protein n=1 Tax=Brassica napus TaxID=3708 RepID=A0A816L0D5_BRANA|nr:unnamed protein product [Brassica napus]
MLQFPETKRDINKKENYIILLFFVVKTFSPQTLLSQLSLSTSASVTSGACALPPPSEGFSSHSPCFASSSTSVYPSDMSTPSGEIAPPAKASGAGSGVRLDFWRCHEVGETDVVKWSDF